MTAPADITIRRATPQDALCLGVLGLQVFLDTYATEGIRPAVAREVLAAFSTAAMQDFITRGDTELFVAEAKAHLVGFAQITLGTPQALVRAERPAEVDRLYVQEPFTARGLGSRLLRQCEHVARERGADVLWLTPWVHNTRAIRFYAKHGYADLGATLFRFEGEAHENRVMAKAL